MVAKRHASGKVKSPGRLLRKMVELHQRGELWLDKNLLGLMDRTRGAGQEQQLRPTCSTVVFP